MQSKIYDKFMRIVIGQTIAMGIKKVYTKPNAPLAQLDRALVFGTRCWGFESLVVRHKFLYFRDI